MSIRIGPASQRTGIPQTSNNNLGVQKALDWRVKHENHKSAIDTLLQITSDDSKILLFLSTAENAIENEGWYTVENNIVKGYGHRVGDIANGMAKLIETGADEGELKLFLSAAECAIKNGYGEEVGDIANGIAKLIETGADEGKWKLFKSAAENAIEHGGWYQVKTIANGIAKLIETGADEGKWKLFKSAAENTIKNEYGYTVGDIANGMVELIKAGADEEKLKLFLSAAESAIKNEHGYGVGNIANGMAELIKAGADEEKWKLFKGVAENVIKNKGGYRVGDIANGMAKFIKHNLSYEEIEKVLGIYSEIVELNNLEGLDHEERKVDLYRWFSRNGIAVKNLEKICPAVHKKVQSDTLGIKKDGIWTGRRNPLLYTEEIAIFNKLTAGEVNEIKSFYDKNKNLFCNNQNTFLRVVRLIKSCNDLEAVLDLNKNYDLADDIVNSFGKELFLALVNKLSVTAPLEVNVDRFLESWDLEHLGSLISTQNSWSDKDKALFTLLIEGGLNGNLHEILSGTGELPYDGEKEELVSNLKKSHDDFLKEMEELKLNANNWLNAHNLINESSILLTVREKSLQELLEEFRSRFNAFKQYLEKNLQTSTDRTNMWNKILKSEQINQLTKENAKSGVLTDTVNKNYMTKELKGFIDALKEKFTRGQIPEVISDLEEIIDQIKDYRPKEKKEEKKEDTTVSIWDPADIGHNLFAGNRTKSCIALGRHATAIFYCICDPGTKYIFTKNKRGNITGYARVFLAKENEKPKLFIDTLDGRTGLKEDGQTPIEPVMKKMKELCKLIGLGEDDIIGRSTKLSGKIGGMADRYFHHAVFNPEFYREMQH